MLAFGAWRSERRLLQKLEAKGEPRLTRVPVIATTMILIGSLSFLCGQLQEEPTRKMAVIVW